MDVAFRGLFVGSGLLESLATLVALVGMLMLVLLVVALAAFAYRSLKGEGPRWPDEVDGAEADDDVRRGRSDDEWKYY